MTEEEYLAHRSDYDGFCTVCNEWTRMGDTEPDAEEYECPECEGKTCVGAEQGLILELFEFED